MGSFLRSGSDLVIPVAELEGALCTLDGHTRLYTAWQRRRFSSGRPAYSFDPVLPAK